MKRTLLLALFLACCAAGRATAGAYPFPDAKHALFGLSPGVSAEVLDRVTETAFIDWLDRYVTTEGAPVGAYRVHRYFAYDFDTVSEGIGWGMLILALLDNDHHPTKKYFDGLWRYYQSHLNKYGLMSWKIDRFGAVEGTDSASDADQNTAMALFFAHKQWGSRGEINYQAEGGQLLLRIISYEVSGKSPRENDFVLKPGAEWGGYQITNPSYYFPAYYRLWKRIDPRWEDVLIRAQKLTDYFSGHYDTGLYPDWAVANGATAYLNYNYSYDACRVPLNLGLDFLWHGENQAALDKISGWFVKKTYGRPELIVDGYQLDGRELGRYNNAAFIGPLAVAARCSPKYQVWLDALYEQLVNLETGGRFGYYNDTIRLLSLLMLGNNFPNLWPEKEELEHEDWLKS